MGMELIRGTAKILNRDIETRGYVSSSGSQVHGQIYSARTVTLEVDGQIITLKHKEPIVLTEGDWIVAAGWRTSNGLQSSVFANRSRKTFNHAPANLATLGGVLMILLGIPLLLFVVGILPIALGGYLLFLAKRMKQANAMLDAELARPWSPETAPA